MDRVDANEAERMKGFLTFGGLDSPNEEVEGQQPTTVSGEQQQRQESRLSSHHPHQQDEAEEAEPSVDWEKVGRTYSAGTKLDTVMEREFKRLNRALEEKLAL